MADRLTADRGRAATLLFLTTADTEILAAAKAAERNLDWRPGAEPFAAAREAQLEKLGDLIAENVNREALLRTMEAGAPAGLPVVSGQLSALSGQQAANGDSSRTEASRRNGGAPASEQAALAATGTDVGGAKADG